MKKTDIITIKGSTVEMTPSQKLELKLDGMVIVEDQIIRTEAYINRIHGKTGEMIAETAKRVIQ